MLDFAQSLWYDIVTGTNKPPKGTHERMRVMKRQIMFRAWEIYRTLTGDRQAKLSMALRQAWMEVKTMNENNAKKNELTETIDRMIDSYNLYTKDGGICTHLMWLLKKHPEDLETIKANKPAFVERINTVLAERAAAAEAKRAAEEAAYEARMARINAIEGLDVLENAHNAIGKWRMGFASAIENENGIGLIAACPKYDFDALNAQYPVAAAYLVAREWEWDFSLTMQELGRKCVDDLLDGMNPDDAIAKMKAAYKDHCENHFWETWGN